MHFQLQQPGESGGIVFSITWSWSTEVYSIIKRGKILKNTKKPHKTICVMLVRKLCKVLEPRLTKTIRRDLICGAISFSSGLGLEWWVDTCPHPSLKTTWGQAHRLNMLLWSGCRLRHHCLLLVRTEGGWISSILPYEMTAFRTCWKSSSRPWPKSCELPEVWSSVFAKECEESQCNDCFLIRTSSSNDRPDMGFVATSSTWDFKRLSVL